MGPHGLTRPRLKSRATGGRPIRDLVLTNINMGTKPRHQTTLAPKEPRHVAWGASPRRGDQNGSQSPEGAAADRRSEEDRRRPFGALDRGGAGFLGLTPQATCLCPSGAGAGVGAT